MNVRLYNPEDHDRAYEIWMNFFKKEFAFPDFKHFLGVFTIEDNDGEIVLIGGPKPIIEVICITDQDASVIKRYKALHMLHETSAHLCKHNGYDQLHCFIQNKPYLEHLLRTGFVRTKGQSLVIGV